MTDLRAIGVKVSIGLGKGCGHQVPRSRGERHLRTHYRVASGVQRQLSILRAQRARAGKIRIAHYRNHGVAHHRPGYTDPAIDRPLGPRIQKHIPGNQGLS